MAINKFEFPGVTLSQEFTSAPTSGTAVLGVVCIGPQYRWYTATVNPLTAIINGGVVSSAPTDVVSSGAYTFDSTDIVPGGVQVNSGFYAYTSGGADDAIEAESGIVSMTTPASEADKIRVGDALVVSGGTITYVITSVSSGATSMTLGLWNTKNNAKASGVVVASDETYYIAREIDETLHTAGGLLSVTGNTITGTVSPSACTVPISALVGGTATGLAMLVAGTATVLGGVRVTGGSASYINARGSVVDPVTVYTVLGEPVTKNPLAVATYCASVEAKGTPVYFLAVPGNTAQDYQNAIAKLEKYEDLYSIVLAIPGGTASEAVIKAAMTEVTTESENEESKVRRTLWYGADVTADTTAGVKVQEAIAQRYTNSYRAQCVFAEGIRVNGISVDSYAAAAAAAGMRSYEAVHRPLSNLPFTAFTVTDTLSRADQREIAKHGIWIVANNSEGTPVTLRQLTTAAANNINVDEESIIANADEIALTLCHVGEDKVGCSNIHPQLLMSLSDDITLNMDAKLLNKSGSIAVGPQLLSWELVELKQDPQALDHVYAVVDCEPPKPFNRFHITLRVL